jgi:hypothetical protein
MIQEQEEKVRSYSYKRFMRDGSVQEITAVVRSRASKHKKEKKHGQKQSNES